MVGLFNLSHDYDAQDFSLLSSGELTLDKDLNFNGFRIIRCDAACDCIRNDHRFYQCICICNQELELINALLICLKHKSKILNISNDKDRYLIKFEVIYSMKDSNNDTEVEAKSNISESDSLIYSIR